MYNDNNNGMITPPVSIRDVKTALGVSTGDLGRLCTSVRINKWAKYKPVHSNKLIRLTEQDFKQQTVTLPGGRQVTTFYGLYLSGTNQLTEELHDVTYEYIGKPQGGENSPYRLLDFVDPTSTAGTADAVGYKPTAKPSLSGSDLSILVTSTQYPFRCEVVFQRTQWGVDILEMQANVLDLQLNHYYCCALVTYNNGTAKWRPMYRGDAEGDTDGNRRFLPLSDAADATTASASFYIDSPARNGNYPEAGPYRVTFFLLYLDNSVNTNHRLDQYTGQWNAVGSGLLLDTQPLAIPDLIGLSMEITTEFPLMTSIVIILGTRSVSVQATPERALTSEQAGNYKVSVRVGDGSSTMKAMTYNSTMGTYGTLSSGSINDGGQRTAGSTHQVHVTIMYGAYNKRVGVWSESVTVT